MEELSALLNRLEDIGTSNEELYDTDVREQMNEVMIEIFIKENSEYHIPESFGMFSEASDKEIYEAFKSFKNGLNKKHIDYKTKISLLGPNGITSKNGQISECFFGEITEKTLLQIPANTPATWLQYDWVYYLFLLFPCLVLTSLIIFFWPNNINLGWYILIFIVVILISFVLGDKLYQFFADRAYRKNVNT